MESPNEIVVDSLGNVFVTGFSSDNIFCVTPSGHIEVIFDSVAATALGTTMDSPSGIDVDDDGYVYVAADATDNAFKIDPMTLLEPCDATLDPDEDGLNNRTEILASTDAFDPDSDLDDVCDGRPPAPLVECTSAEDLDNDGVIDPGETDPLDDNTDGDSQLDGSDPCPAYANSAYPYPDANMDGIPNSCQCGDTNADGVHTAADLANMQSCFGGGGGCDPDISDTNGNGVIDLEDISNLLAIINTPGPFYHLRCLRRLSGDPVPAPEPGVGLSVAIGAAVLAGLRRRRA